MKIYRRSEFIALPNGILFCKGKKWFWETLEIKTHSYDNDFVALSLSDIDWHDSGDMVDKQEEMLSTGKSYPLDLEHTTRDGCFDDEDIFLVYESDDIKNLISVLQKAASIQ